MKPKWSEKIKVEVRIIFTQIQVIKKSLSKLFILHDGFTFKCSE